MQAANGADGVRGAAPGGTGFLGEVIVEVERQEMALSLLRGGFGCWGAGNTLLFCLKLKKKKVVQDTSISEVVICVQAAEIGSV